jgi:hypothetical protein
MSNNYSMEYGYQSLIYPSRMFKTLEDAEAFDAVESRSIITGVLFTPDRIKRITLALELTGDEEDYRVVLAALRWTVNASDAAERDKRIAEYEKKGDQS